MIVHTTATSTRVMRQPSGAPLRDVRRRSRHMRSDAERLPTWLNADVPEGVVSARANVSPAVLSEHYDRRTRREKMEQRRRYLDQI
jgi:hypothetical protein